MGYRNKLTELLKDKKILIVGAGGIGCELLKNVVLTGFKNIHVIDLDTIDVSNLNRQFLFRREHVGKSKAEVATAAVGKLLPDVNITFDHDSIFNGEKFGMTFFKQFDLVMNALDNRSARNHVNRICLSAEVPLIESGSAGYLGQVSVILRGQSECYECTEKPVQKTFPGCTIRNTPSEHIHCTVWSKHVFNQLFGELAIDDDVSPDINDPELHKEEANGPTSDESKENGSGDKEAKEENGTLTNGTNGNNNEKNGVTISNTRTWAEENGYNPELLFNKLFHDDIEYLLKMHDLWKERRRPTPLLWNNFDEGNTQQTDDTSDVNSEWSIGACARVFADCVQALKKRKEELPEGQFLSWDKDDEEAMRFVAACANIRARIFGIPGKSCFEIKSMAGNIIPAIATTNAMVAGMVVIEALKVLRGQKEKVRTVFVRRIPNTRGKVLVDQDPEKPNPKCCVCSEKRELFIRVNTKEMTVKQLVDVVLKGHMCMQNPDVTVGGNIIVSSEEGETTELEGKTLSSLQVSDGCLLECDDFSQDLNFMLCVMSDHNLKPDEFKVDQDKGASAPAKAVAEEPTLKRKTTGQMEDMEQVSDTVAEVEEPSRKRKSMAPLGDGNQETDVEEAVKRARIDEVQSAVVSASE